MSATHAPCHLHACPTPLGYTRANIVFALLSPCLGEAGRPAGSALSDPGRLAGPGLSSDDVVGTEEALPEAEHESPQAQHCQGQHPYQQSPLHLQPTHAKACRRWDCKGCSAPEDCAQSHNPLGDLVQPPDGLQVTPRIQPCRSLWCQAYTSSNRTRLADLPTQELQPQTWLQDNPQTAASTGSMMQWLSGHLLPCCSQPVATIFLTAGRNARSAICHTFWQAEQYFVWRS